MVRASGETGGPARCVEGGGKPAGSAGNDKDFFAGLENSYPPSA